MVYLLKNTTPGFPDPREGDEDGLFAIGGELTPEWLTIAYSYGIFPWFPFRAEDTDLLDENGKPYVQWYCPMDRFVLFRDDIHISHSMKQLFKKVSYPNVADFLDEQKDLKSFKDYRGEFVTEYEVTMDMDFRGVIHNCGALRESEEGAWLGPEIKEVYTRLHEELKFAHSVEVWQVNPDTLERKLVGGLFGEKIDNVFCGESMFSLVPSASKIALISLAWNMPKLGLDMIDLQLETPHLKSMGGRHITYKEYMEVMGIDIDGEIEE